MPTSLFLFSYGMFGLQKKYKKKRGEKTRVRKKKLGEKYKFFDQPNNGTKINFFFFTLFLCPLLTACSPCLPVLLIKVLFIYLFILCMLIWRLATGIVLKFWSLIDFNLFGSFVLYVHSLILRWLRVACDLTIFICEKLLNCYGIYVHDSVSSLKLYIFFFIIIFVPESPL